MHTNGIRQYNANISKRSFETKKDDDDIDSDDNQKVLFTIKNIGYF
jgi:hypothetical protein